MARIFIGVSWPYANGPQHLGHLASTYVPADIFARYHRLRGDDVLMVSGSDAHGTPILVAAEKEGTSAEAIFAKYHEVNRDALQRLGVTFDVFTSTHTVLHQRTAQEVFLALLTGGFVARRTQDAAYCPKHQRFLPDRYLVGTCPHCGYAAARGDECDNCGRPLEPRQLGSPRCALCGTPAEFRPSEQFYLELDKLATQIAEYVRKVGPGWRGGTLRVTENFLEEGLHPTAITRDLDWGVPLPLEGYDAKRLYVWFEALTGYLSAAKEWAVRAGRPDAWRAYWHAGEAVRHYYFVGKDNRFYHTIVWPGMLLGVGGLHLPDDVPANEWLLIGGAKVSKSRSKEGSVFLPSLLETYAPDHIRFYASLLAPQNHDTEFDWAEFHRIREEILANQFGNLVQRALVFARDRYEGRVPAPPHGWSPEHRPAVGGRLREAHRRITEELERVHLKEALELALEEVREANRAFHDERPWQAAPEDRARAVYETLWRIRAVATWLAPYLPFASAEIYRMLGFAGPPGPGDWDQALEPVPDGQALGEIRPLFPREDEAAAEAVTPAAPPPGPVPLAVQAGVVRSVKPHPSADRLYVLEVDVGTGTPRTLVAGLRSSYPESELLGRPITLLANLAPRTIRKITSQGMVLAAEAGERAVLLRPPPGTPAGAFADGAAPSDRTISHDEFSSLAVEVGRVEGPGSAGHTAVRVGDRTVDIEGEWRPGTQGVVVRSGPEAPTGRLLAFGPGRPVEPSEPVADGAKVR